MVKGNGIYAFGVPHKASHLSNNLQQQLIFQIFFVTHAKKITVNFLRSVVGGAGKIILFENTAGNTNNGVSPKENP